MSAASSCLTLVEIAAPTGRRHPSPAAHSPAEEGRPRIERVRTTGFCLIGRWVSAAHLLCATAGESRRRGSRGTPESHHLVP